MLFYNKIKICYFEQILSIFNIIKYFLIKKNKKNLKKNSFSEKSLNFNSMRKLSNFEKKRSLNKSVIFENTKKKFLKIKRKIKNRKTYFINKLNLQKEKLNNTIHEKLIKRSKSKNFVIENLNKIFFSSEKNKSQKLKNLNLKGKYFKKNYSLRKKNFNKKFFDHEIDKGYLSKNLFEQSKFINKIQSIDLKMNKNISSFISKRK